MTLRNALDSLCIDVPTSARGGEHDQEIPDDPEINDDNKVTATPVEKVYEHGFYPLTGGFRVKPGGNFEVFDQWIEVLPTDQVVPVEVAYNPKTGRLICARSRGAGRRHALEVTTVNVGVNYPWYNYGWDSVMSLRSDVKAQAELGAIHRHRPGLPS